MDAVENFVFISNTFPAVSLTVAENIYCWAKFNLLDMEKLKPLVPTAPTEPAIIDEPAFNVMFVVVMLLVSSELSVLTSILAVSVATDVAPSGGDMDTNSGAAHNALASVKVAAVLLVLFGQVTVTEAGV